MPCIQLSEIESGRAHRLLHLVSVIVSQKYPSEMGLNDFNGVRTRLRICLRSQKRADFLPFLEIGVDGKWRPIFVAMFQLSDSIVPRREDVNSKKKRAQQLQ